jgi:pimeloyl-ACP methyl ester carboxylesterase
MYTVKRTPRSEFIPIRKMNYHVLVWGDAASPLPPLVLMHGWMDVAASYQFMVDALSEAFFSNRLIIAADWRGYGKTTGAPVDNYWFPDYLADLDFLLDHYAGDKQVDLVGHSMGGNVVMMYAGSRPARIRRLINLEGFGMPANPPSKAPGRYAQWMDELKKLHRGELNLTAYDKADGVARRLMKTNQRLGRDEAGKAKANWLARHWAAENAQGKWEILGDPAHKIVNATLSNLDEAMELYKSITAPVLVVEASDDSLTGWWNGKFTLAEFHERLKNVPDCTLKVVHDAGHMMHHDQPLVLAGMLEEFVKA